MKHCGTGSIAWELAIEVQKSTLKNHWYVVAEPKDEVHQFFLQKEYNYGIALFQVPRWNFQFRFWLISNSDAVKNRKEHVPSASKHV